MEKQIEQNVFFRKLIGDYEVKHNILVFINPSPLMVFTLIE